MVLPTFLFVPVLTGNFLELFIGSLLVEGAFSCAGCIYLIITDAIQTVTTILPQNSFLLGKIKT